MMRTRRTRSVFLACVAVTFVSAACSADIPENSEDMASAAERVDPALFDSISWESQGTALERGRTVYLYSCARCHGPKGAGDGRYRLAGTVLHPPTFLASDWRFAMDMDGLRAMIYAGAPHYGMPDWGDRGLTPRDVDAVARYITWTLWANR